MLCAQGLGYLVGIICIKYEQIAIGVSIGLYLMLCMFCNIFTPIKEMPQLFQMISDISFNKFVYYSVLILIYGFGRCPSNQLSLVMFKYDMNEQLFWFYAKYLVIYFVILRILAFIVLYIRANTLFSGIKLKDIITKYFEFFHIERRNTEQPVCDESKSSVFTISSESSIDMSDSYEIDFNFDEDLDKKLSIAWIDLSLKSQNQLFSDEKIILRQLNGSVEFGSLNALMGPSGAGKTSLLRCLNGRYHNQMSDETKIYLSKFKKIRTCFISQDASEHLLKGLTAKQALIYASKLKNSDRELDHENSIENLMIDLLITDIEDTNVEKCSKGEQKRLVMAMEMTSYKKPNLICIDEPTSGLDSNAAEVVINFK
jgi:ABC-type lipoprotein export system ATPase subunit